MSSRQALVCRLANYVRWAKTWHWVSSMGFRLCPAWLLWRWWRHLRRAQKVPDVGSNAQDDSDYWRSSADWRLYRSFEWQHLVHRPTTDTTHRWIARWALRPWWRNYDKRGIQCFLPSFAHFIKTLRPNWWQLSNLHRDSSLKAFQFWLYALDDYHSSRVPESSRMGCRRLSNRCPQTSYRKKRTDWGRSWLSLLDRQRPFRQWTAIQDFPLWIKGDHTLLTRANWHVHEKGIGGIRLESDRLLPSVVPSRPSFLGCRESNHDKWRPWLWSYVERPETS